MEHQQKPVASPAPRINVWRLGRNVILALILPVSLAIVVDMIVGLWPIVTLIVASFAFPIAGIVVIRSTMQELRRVIQELEPELAPESKDLSESATISTGNATSITEV